MRSRFCDDMQILKGNWEMWGNNSISKIAMSKIKIMPTCNCANFVLFAATRSAAGLIEWNNPSEALEALAACNHYVIRDAGTVFVLHVYTVCGRFS